jgi:hypothetical protein
MNYGFERRNNMPILYTNRLLVFSENDICETLTLSEDNFLVFCYQINPKVKIMKVINNEIIEFDNPDMVECKKNEKIIVNNENRNIFSILLYRQDKEQENIDQIKNEEERKELDKEEELKKFNQFKDYAGQFLGKEKTNEIINEITTNAAALKCGDFFLEEAFKCVNLALNSYYEYFIENPCDLIDYKINNLKTANSRIKMALNLANDDL